MPISSSLDESQNCVLSICDAFLHSLIDSVLCFLSACLSPLCVFSKYLEQVPETRQSVEEGQWDRANTRQKYKADK